MSSLCVVPQVASDQNSPISRPPTMTRVERQDDRPAEPVADGRDRADERRVALPRLVGVHGDAAGEPREHRRHLGVDVVVQAADHHGDAPDDDRAPAAQREHGQAERREQEARIRERDDEAVVPASWPGEALAPRHAAVATGISSLGTPGLPTPASDHRNGSHGGLSRSECPRGRPGMQRSPHIARPCRARGARPQCRRAAVPRPAHHGDLRLRREPQGGVRRDATSASAACSGRPTASPRTTTRPSGGSTSATA